MTGPAFLLLLLLVVICAVLELCRRESSKQATVYRDRYANLLDRIRQERVQNDAYISSLLEKIHTAEQSVAAVVAAHSNLLVAVREIADVANVAYVNAAARVDRLPGFPAEVPKVKS